MGMSWVTLFKANMYKFLVLLKCKKRKKIGVINKHRSP